MKIPPFMWLITISLLLIVFNGLHHHQPERLLPPTALALAFNFGLLWMAISAWKRRINRYFLAVPMLYVLTYLSAVTINQMQMKELKEQIAAANAQVTPIPFNTSKHDLVINNKNHSLPVAHLILYYDIAKLYKTSTHLKENHYVAYRLIGSKLCEIAKPNLTEPEFFYVSYRHNNLCLLRHKETPAKPQVIVTTTSKKVEGNWLLPINYTLINIKFPDGRFLSLIEGRAAPLKFTLLPLLDFSVHEYFGTINILGIKGGFVLPREGTPLINEKNTDIIAKALEISKSPAAERISPDMTDEALESKIRNVYQGVLAEEEKHFNLLTKKLETSDFRYQILNNEPQLVNEKREELLSAFKHAAEYGREKGKAQERIIYFINFLPDDFFVKHAAEMESAIEAHEAKYGYYLTNHNPTLAKRLKAASSSQQLKE